MSKARISIAALAMSLVCVFFLTAVGFAGDELRIGVSGEFQPGHPLLPNSEMTGLAYSFSLLPLVSLEKGWTWQCRLCTKLPTQANRGIELFTDKIGLTKIALHLAIPENARWGDGQPITTKDLSFTWQVMQRVPTNFRTSPALLEIEDLVVRPKEQHHFTIILRSVSDPYPILNSFFVLSQHLEQPIVDKEKWGAYFSNSLYVKEATQPGLYNGPFLVQGLSADKLTLIRNSSALFTPKLDKVSVQFFDSFRLLSQALTSSKLDLVSGLPVWDDVFNLIDTLAKTDSALKLVRNDSSYYEHIDFNLQNPLFQDTSVRKALAYAINKEFILSTLTKNWTVPAVSPVHPGDRFFSEKVAFYEYAPKKAQKLLAHSDWNPNPDGLRTKRTRALAFEVLTIDDPWRIKIAQYLVQAWKNIGAQVTIKTLPLGEFREKIAKRHFSGAALYAWDLSPLKNKRSLFHSSAIPSLSNQYSGQNVTGWINAKVDDTLAKLHISFNDTERQNLMATLQREYTGELPGIPLFFREEISLIPKPLRVFTAPLLNAQLGLAAAYWE